MSEQPPAPRETPREREPVAAPAAPARGSRARTALVLSVVLGVAFVVGAVGVSLLEGQDGPGEGGGVRIEAGADLQERVSATQQEPLPEMTLLGFGAEDADPVDLTAYRGSPLIVNFWASWCAPCVKEMPDFQRFSEEHGARVPLLGVNVQDAPANAGAFVEELGITYDLATDPAGELYAAVRGFGMPTTLFVDEAGTITYRHTGPLDAEELRSLAEAHLGLAPR